ncbi:MAG: hypothetical protein ABW208_07295 [Pyrinomonadaceae bacterium]
MGMRAAQQQTRPTLDEQIDEIMESFNFDQTRGVMEFLGLKWAGVDEVTGAETFLPTVEDMRILAGRMLREVAGIAKDNSLRTCGFVVTKRHGLLSLYFVAEQTEHLP